MEHELILQIEATILVLLLVASIGAVAFKRINFPYTVGLAIVGMLLGFAAIHFDPLEPLQTLNLSHELILFIFLPPLVFESALNLDSRLLLHNLTPVMVLAAPGLLISTGIVALLLAWLTPLSLPEALLFGSLISATDPVAVIALFKELGVPQRLMILVEGESLFNDATAIVTFNIVLGAIASGVFSAATLGQGIIGFFSSFIGGILVGGILGYLMGYAISLVQGNPLVLATISAVVAYGSFIIAEHNFHVSGVIAVVSAGMVVGWLRCNRLHPEQRTYLHEFWEYAAFLANSLIFLLVGITTASFIVDLSTSEPIFLSLLLAVITVVIARAVVVFSLVPLVNLCSPIEKIDRNYQIIGFWGGLRGAVSLALALSLDPDLVNRDLIIALTLGVALFTLLVPGISMAKVIKALKLDQPSIFDRIGQAQALIEAKRKAMVEVKELEAIDSCSQEVIDSYQAKYKSSLQAAERKLSQLWEDCSLSQPRVRQIFWLQALSIEKQRYRDLYDQGFISAPILSQLMTMMHFKRDAVLEERIPPQIHEVVFWEATWERAIARIFKPILSNSNWLKQRRNRAFGSRYSYYNAIAHVSEQVALDLKQLAEDCGVEAVIEEESAREYEKIAKEATERLDILKEQSPEWVEAIQNQATKRTAILAEQEAIESLVAEGAISEAAAEKVREMIGT